MNFNIRLCQKHLLKHKSSSHLYQIVLVFRLLALTFLILKYNNKNQKLHMFSKAVSFFFVVKYITDGINFTKIQTKFNIFYSQNTLSVKLGYKYTVNIDFKYL